MIFWLQTGETGMVMRKADSEDIDMLIQIRIDFLVEDKGSLTEEEEHTIRSQLAEYYLSHINRDFIAMIAVIDDRVVSSVFLAVMERPANTVFLNGKTGTIHNVYTYPAFRKMGLASMLLDAVLKEARQMGVPSIELIATKVGEPLYDKIGFRIIDNVYMRLCL